MKHVSVMICLVDNSSKNVFKSSAKAYMHLLINSMSLNTGESSFLPSKSI